jgi:hypothetical protein
MADFGMIYMKHIKKRSNPDIELISDNNTIACYHNEYNKIQIGTRPISYWPCKKYLEEEHIIGVFLHEYFHWAQFMFLSEEYVRNNILSKYDCSEESFLERTNPYKSKDVWNGVYDNI